VADDEGANARRRTTAGSTEAEHGTQRIDRPAARRREEPGPLAGLRVADLERCATQLGVLAATRERRDDGGARHQEHPGGGLPLPQGEGTPGEGVVRGLRGAGEHCEHEQQDAAADHAGIPSKRLARADRPRRWSHGPGHTRFLHLAGHRSKEVIEHASGRRYRAAVAARRPKEGLMVRRLVMSTALLFVLDPVPSSAQPVGPRFQANQFVVGNQGGPLSCGYYKRHEQDVASDADGNFVVVWSDGQSYSYYPSRIVGRRYDRFGIPQGDEFEVSAGTRRHRTPSVSMDPAGSFVVAWNAYAYDSDSYSDVWARRFDAAGGAQGPQFRVSNNAYTYSYGSYSYTLFHYQYIQNPDVAKDAAGNFIVVWQHATTDPDFLGDADDQQIIGRRYNAAGMAQGGQFKLSDGTNDTYINSKAEVATQSNGDFVVVWKALDSGDAIVARQFSAAGAPLGGEIPVSSAVFEGVSDVASDGSGGFVVVWGSSSFNDPSPAELDVAARRYDATGTPLGSAFLVNTTTTGDQCGPSIARLANGNFVVTWHGNYTVTSNNGYGQVLSSSGGAVGSQFLLDTTGGYVNGTSVAAQENDYVVVWTDGSWQSVSNPDAADIYGQRFGTTETPACSPTPLTTCRQQTRRAGVLRFKQASNPASSRLAWVWSKGEATSHDDYGDPFDDTSYVFCLYDGSAAPQPLATLIAPRGNFCGRVPCWRQLGGPQGTIQWVNSFGNFYGLTQIRLINGGDGAAKIVVTARGTNLDLPATPLTAPVVFQAQATNGECWSSDYDVDIKRNDGGVFRAKPSVP
jgi:hypothetical protein